MTDLPRGTVAFLMTDIEGSTRLVRDLGPAFPELLGDHFRLLGEAITAAGGTHVSSEGDSVFAVFPSARQAIAAAVAAQRALVAHTWPAGATVRLRMGINAGEAVLGGRDYTGLEVHRTARIMAAGHGGQILLSAAARTLAGDLPEGVSVREMGSHQLRDMPGPEELLQLVVSDLPSDFPPLRTQATTVPTNLPRPLTRFVGRSAELAAASALLDETRLLTLTGPGGTGKTRLSIEVARAVLPRFADGVWFVPLDLVRDPALVVPAVAHALGLPETPGTPPIAAIAELLRGKPTLIVLDNLEQVIAAAPDVANLLSAAPSLTILATSREPLAIAGERLFSVPPLAIPDEPGAPTAATLAANDCVTLFVERARAARADFALTDANAAAIAAICRRLDGLPLALELAAARINVLAPEQILARMSHRLTLLASARRDLTDRQRTLRGAIEWSYDLLTPQEQTFFRRFAVFSGGAELDAVQAVVDPTFELGDGLDLTSALVDRSLLRATQSGDANRLAILETLREYAADQLAADPTEATSVGRRHAAYFRALAEASKHALTDPRRDQILEQLDRELPNFRAAIEFALGDGDVATGALIGVSLGDFWHARGHLADGRQLLGRLVEAATRDGPRPENLPLLTVASEIASWIGDYAESRRYAELGLAIAEASGDLHALGSVEQGIGWATFMSDPAYARDHFQAAVAYGRTANDEQVLRGALQGLAIALIRLGDVDAARATVEEAIAVATALNDRYINAFNLVTRGFIRGRQGDREGALDDDEQALREAQDAGSAVGTALAVEAIAIDALNHGDAVRGATLAVAAGQLRASVGGGPTVQLAGLPDPVDAARAALDPTAFAAAAAAGRALTTEAMVALAIRPTTDIPRA